MDETMNTGFPIPPSRPMFGEGDVDIEKKPLPESDFIMSFANETGDKAVILTSVEVADGEILERYGRADLEGYANDLLDGGEDELGLQIGEIYEGESAEEDARAEAFRLDDMFNPGEEATNEELIKAVEDAQADVGTEQDLDLGGELPDEDVMPPLPDEEEEEADEEIADLGEAEEDLEEDEEDLEEEEPMLGQFKKAKK